MKTFLFITLALTSCDPYRRINMKNNTDGEAEIIWTIKEDSLHNSPFFISSSKEQKFKLESDKPGNKINLSCGVGTWTQKEINNVVDDLESVVIKWNNGEIRLDSTEQIKKFFMTRRKGIGNTKIEIAIKN